MLSEILGFELWYWNYLTPNCIVAEGHAPNSVN